MKFQQNFFPSQAYDLGQTLASGQAFRWTPHGGSWEGVIDHKWVRLKQLSQGILAEAFCPINDWNWLKQYLQLEVDLASIMATFPVDPPMRMAVASCPGLRLLKQDPWECLASFILSSTKQIVQIQQIIGHLCQCFGKPLQVPDGHPPVQDFPSVESLASASEAELRACKMGFRAPNLQKTARLIDGGKVDLQSIYSMPLEQARNALVSFPGVGTKIANCVLLFAYGFQGAFPVDVWIMKALTQLYFPRRKPTEKRLTHFAATHFGPNAGYAQQYLFHYMRTKRISHLAK